MGCLLIVLALSTARLMVVSEDEYMNAYFVIYSDYLLGNGTYSKEELSDIVEYYLTTDDLAGNLYQTGDKSGEMIGDILVKAGVDFDCGTCDSSLLGIRCCIYRVGEVPSAYECVGNEVMTVKSYSWVELWQCTYGCCGTKCCPDPGGGRTLPTYPTTISQVTTSVAATTSLAQVTSTTLAVSTTTSSTSTTLAETYKMTLLFVPVNWDSGIEQFHSAVDRLVGRFLANTPLKDCQGKVQVKKISSVCDVYAPTSSAGCLKNATVIRDLMDCARSSGESYDYIIGLGASGMCGISPGGGWGFAQNSRATAFVIPDPGAKVLTHEIGNLWGLDDEYLDICRCFNGTGYYNGNNCLDIALGGEDAVGTDPLGYELCAGGSRCPASYGMVTCKGNKNPAGGRCLMGTYIDPSVFCEHCRDHLSGLGFLRC